MRRFTSIAAILVMLTVMLPVLACAATPKMSRMERDCCRQMHGTCGEMAKQGCCQVEVRSDLNRLPALVVIAPVPRLTILAMVYLLLIDTSATTGYRWHMPEEHSPPGLLIAATTVLQI